MTSEIEIAVVALAVQRVASAVHELIPKFVSLLPDGSGSPCALAKQALFRAVPADVLFIDASKRPERKEGDDVWTLIRFDLLEPGVSQVRFVDELEAEELSHHGELLSEHFNINDPVQSGLSDLKFKSCIQQQQYTFLGSFDIRKSPERYGAELCFWLNLETSLVQFFLKEPDFESRYGLRPDPIVSAPELLRLDFATDAHPTDNRLRRYTLQELQEDVADIQLIPQVPDGVRELIGRAKMLYVYGYFEYSFFTIASHYTHAAIEAALRARWSLCLPLPSTLKFKDKEVSTERTGFSDIESCCALNGWKVQRLSINGRAFPWKSDLVISWLRDEEVINDWQRWRFSNVYSKLRNLYSHMDGCSYHGGESDSMRGAVEQINILFDSVLL